MNRVMSDIWLRLASITMMVLLSQGCTLRELTYDYHPPGEVVSSEVKLQFDVKSVFEWEITGEWDFMSDTRSYVPSGNMRYIIRFYPLSSGSRVASDYVLEHVLYGEIAEMHDEVFTLELYPGEYSMMVWADLEIPGSDMEFFYDASDFSNIFLTQHQGNTDYRSGFRGVKEVIIPSATDENGTEAIVVDMQRPFAKYQIVTNDLAEFIEKQIAALAKESGSTSPVGPESIDLADYKVIIAYPGFMPSAYDMFIDKPVDSKTGVFFESELTGISENEALLGFDYVFVNDSEASVNVQVGLYDRDGEKIALCEPMEIPLKRGVLTTVKGDFLMQQAAGNIGINPDFEDGDYNIPITW